MSDSGFDDEFVHIPSNTFQIKATGSGRIAADGTFTWSVAITNGRIHRIHRKTRIG